MHSVSCPHVLLLNVWQPLYPVFFRIKRAISNIKDDALIRVLSPSLKIKPIVKEEISRLRPPCYIFFRDQFFRVFQICSVGQGRTKSYWSVSPQYQVVSNQNAVDCNQVWIGSYPSLSRFVPKPLVKSFIYLKYLTHECVNRYQSLRRTSWWSGPSKIKTKFSCQYIWDLLNKNNLSITLRKCNILRLGFFYYLYYWLFC